jgi:hypothetical protein
MTDRKSSDWAGVIVAYVIVIAVNAAANIVPIAGQMTGDVSDKYFSLFTPAGYTFGIWGVIYLALACYVVFQALPAQRGNEMLASIGRLFILSSAANALWIFAWHYEWIMVSLILMFAILYCLIRIYRQLDIASDSTSIGERVFVNVPFSLYTAWISVATLANISAMQAALDLNDYELSGAEWTLLKLSIAGAIGAAVVLRNRDFVYVLVVAWAAFGIVNGQSDTPVVAGAAGVVGCVGVWLAIYELYRRIAK